MTHPTDAAIAQANELMACPFCGGADLEVFGDRPNEAMLGGFNVCCRNPGCQATCRHSGDRAKAIRAWNRRTPARELDAEKGGEFPDTRIGVDTIAALYAKATPPAQAAEAVVVTEAMVDAAAKAIFFEETGYRLLDDDDPAHPGGYTVTYTRYARAALSAAIAAMQAGE